MIRTLLEKIRLQLDFESEARVLEPVLKWCATYSLDPCAKGDPAYVTGSRYADCRHCVADVLLREIGEAIGAHP